MRIRTSRKTKPVQNVGLGSDKTPGIQWSMPPRAKEIYDSMGIDYKKKSIIYSDALTVDKALKIKEQCDEVGFTCEWC